MLKLVQTYKSDFPPILQTFFLKTSICSQYQIKSLINQNYQEHFRKFDSSPSKILSEDPFKFSIPQYQRICATTPSPPYVLAQKTRPRCSSLKPTKKQTTTTKKKNDLFHNDSNSRPLESIRRPLSLSLSSYSQSDKSLASKQAASNDGDATRPVERAGGKRRGKAAGNVWAAIRGHTMCFIERERERERETERKRQRERERVSEKESAGAVCCARRDSALAGRPLRSARASDGRIARATVLLGHAVSPFAIQRSVASLVISSYPRASSFTVERHPVVCAVHVRVLPIAFATPLRFPFPLSCTACVCACACTTIQFDKLKLTITETSPHVRILKRLFSDSLSLSLSVTVLLVVGYCCSSCCWFAIRLPVVRHRLILLVI